jgi:putative ABC transport system permease protein
MLLKMAICTVWHEREKLSGAIAGVALGVFLLIFQWGLYFAYKRDTTVVLDAFDADIWIVPKNQSMFDGFTHMDDLPYWKAKETPGVRDAARIVWGDAAWRIPSSGGKDYVQVLGIDFESSIKASFHFRDQDVPRLVRADGHVLIGTKDREKLGVAERPDGPFEISGRQAFVVGLVDDVRLFTTAGFVLTDVENAREFLRLPSSHVNYVVCKCLPRANVGDVVRQLRAVIPEHDVLTTRQFHDLCSNYWETVSGIGPLIFISSILGVTVGFLLVILTFYISSIEKIPVFGCLKALGGTITEIAAILGVQVLIVFLLGSAIAGVLLCTTMVAIRNSMVSVWITPNLVLAGLGAMLACSALGALLSIRTLFLVDPGQAFRT